MNELFKHISRNNEKDLYVLQRVHVVCIGLRKLFSYQVTVHVMLKTKSFCWV